MGDLIADIGGYLGLLLGASILSIYDKTCNFVGRAKKYRAFNRLNSRQSIVL